jgi:hypothetical protein
MLVACYQQPVLSPQRPLRCNPSAKTDECPKGYACQAGVCGPTSCSHMSDCPAGLSCTNRGCVAPPDGGEADGGIQIPNVPDAEALEAGAPEDGQVAPDSPVTLTPDGGQD